MTRPRFSFRQIRYTTVSQPEIIVKTIFQAANDEKPRHEVSDTEEQEEDEGNLRSTSPLLSFVKIE